MFTKIITYIITKVYTNRHLGYTYWHFVYINTKIRKTKQRYDSNIVFKIINMLKKKFCSKTKNKINGILE